MEYIRDIFDFILHIDVHLEAIIRAYGLWTYGILALIIFSETGFVVTPFLPGDSLLFAAGAIAVNQVLSPLLLFVILTAAAILGNTVNYWIGYFIGPNILLRKNIRFVNRDYLQRAHSYFESYGGRTIIFARFLPIFRTFVPFIAGICTMSYGVYMLYNAIAGALWVGSFVFAGYYFGNLPIVRSNFTFVIIAILVVSTLPAVIEALRRRSRVRQSD
ncbi:MAG TPA: DedA family protein [Bacteroidota bacterium]|nr:DedA family protein [Bacteroidota bacterium]